eukprot:3899745-Amphidinium_carterae.1
MISVGEFWKPRDYSKRSIFFESPMAVNHTVLIKVADLVVHMLELGPAAGTGFIEEGTTR